MYLYTLYNVHLNISVEGKKDHYRKIIRDIKFCSDIMKRTVESLKKGIFMVITARSGEKVLPPASLGSYFHPLNCVALAIGELKRTFPSPLDCFGLNIF